MTSSLAEVAGCLLGGVLVTGLSSRKRIRTALIIINLLPLTGAIGILLCWQSNSTQWTAFFILLTNLGIGSSYVVQSSVTVLLFPEDQQISVFSLCNFFAIAVSALAPLCIELLN